MHRIEAQQMGVGLDRAEVVDPDHLDILSAGLGDRPQHVAADAAKPVNRDPDCHSISPQRFETRIFAGDYAQFLGISMPEAPTLQCIIIPNVPPWLLRIQTL